VVFDSELSLVSHCLTTSAASSATDSAQSLYALRVLRHHGLGESGLQSADDFQGGRRVSADIRSVSVVWIYHQHRQTVHRGVLSPEQSKAKQKRFRRRRRPKPLCPPNYI